MEIDGGGRVFTNSNTLMIQHIAFFSITQITNFTFLKNIAQTIQHAEVQIANVWNASSFEILQTTNLSILSYIHVTLVMKQNFFHQFTNLLWLIVHHKWIQYSRHLFWIRADIFSTQTSRVLHNCWKDRLLKELILAPLYPFRQSFPLVNRIVKLRNWKWSTPFPFV